MRNPLIKRLSKELKSDFAKYLVLFVFITAMIAFISGFLVASGSMKKAYDESFEKYNIEDGNLELMYEAEETVLAKIEAGGVTLYENFYLEKETDDFESKLRIFKNRTKVNLVCLMEGQLPDAEDEIALDRMYAENNDIFVGDTIKVGGRELCVTGLVALSDYSALFSSNSDMMFDAMKFGVAVMTNEGFCSMGEAGLHYSYSWVYDKKPYDDMEAKEQAEELLEKIAPNAPITNYNPQYSNQAIRFTGNDIGRDGVVMAVLLYIIVVILAFIFAITTTNTISKEAMVIGTLRASGYTRGELLVHYLTMPVLVTLISAVLGNILGYTIFKDIAADIYYQSYSLTTYVTLWNADAFIKTTVVPIVLMFGINFVILADKLKLSPLKFIRRDLSKRQKKKAFRLNTKIGIMHRFRLRIIFQNMPNYIVIAVGIFLANVILLLGIAFPALLDKYQTDIASNMLAEYQYVLKYPMETQNDTAEKYSAVTLKTVHDTLRSEPVTVYGIDTDSDFIDVDLDDKGVYISDAYAEKFSLDKGDTLLMTAEFEDKDYEFEIAGVYHYPAGIAVFMEREYCNEVFEQEKEYFNGYFASSEITDIEEKYIATKITEADLTKTSRQLMHSLGSMMDLILGLGVVMYMLIIYLLTKIIIEKNAQSISMTKILGYTNREISGLYVMATSLVVIGSLIVTIPLADVVMEYACILMLSEYSGWIPYYVPYTAYMEMIILGVVSYAIIAFTQYRKVKRIPMDMVLKNVE